MKKMFSNIRMAGLIASGLILTGFNPVFAEAELSKKQKSQVISNFAAALKDNYVLVKEGKRIGDELIARDNNGIFDQKNDRNEFSRELNRNIRELANDLHLQVQSNQGESRRGPEGSGPAVEASILDGNIGLLSVNILMGSEQDIHNSMNKLADTDGLIIDVRQCPGGEFNVVTSLVSHFLPEDETIITYYTRGQEPNVSKSHLPDGQSRYTGKPVYVVTSAFTGSGCEELSFDLKYHNLGFVIGETTAGAGFGLSGEPVDLSNDFVAFIPDTNPVHPKYEGGFEKVGVTPDIEASSIVALDNAHQLILSEIYQANPNNQSVRNALLESSLKSAKLTKTWAENARIYREFIGQYGDNKSLVLEGGELKLGGVAGMMLILNPEELDMFGIQFTPGQKLRINRDKKGEVESISISTPHQASWNTHLKQPGA